MAFFDLLLGAFTVFAATTLGSAVVLLFRNRKIEQMDYSNIISFSAGIMAFSAVEMFIESKNDVGNTTATMAFLAGVLVFLALERSLPHLHFLVRRTRISDSRKKAAMIAGTITIHNLPEGFAVAASFAHSTPLGWLVTSTIAIQDVPEGTLVSTPLACYGIDCVSSFKFGGLSGVIEGLAAIFGYLFLSLVTAAVPPALGFSAGAMSYVVLAELMPDAFKGKAWAVALSFVAGVLAAFGIAAFLRF
ncbi:ZIP family metal transporter [Candidatus Micrarchaeota archaeon]|nr:ZIP family metal transporter [Candidatus Micrarchaeota archaeon]